MENSDIALILLGIAGICVVGAKHFIDEERNLETGIVYAQSVETKSRHTPRFLGEIN